MPNSEYLRLKALLESNPQYRTMLDTISKAEGTWNKNAYSTKVGGGSSDWKNGKDRQSIPIGKSKSNAHGKYQFMNDTWDTLSTKLGLSGFSPEEQDVAALSLLEKQGSLKHIDNGDMEKAIFAAAPVWAALPKDANGNSAMHGQKAKSLSTVLRYTKSNEAARAAINDDYKKQNEKNGEFFQRVLAGGVNDIDSAPIQRKVKAYWQEINNIQANKDLSEEQKNLEKHAVKQRYYRAGYMSAINADINETNRKYNEFYREISQFSDRESVDRKGQNMTMQEQLNLGYDSVDKSTFERLKKKALEFNIDLGTPEYLVAGGDKNNKKAQRYINTSEITAKLNKIDSIYTPRKMEEGLLKYGKTKDEYDTEVAKNAPDDSGSGGLVDDINNGNETPEEKRAREDVDAKAKANAARLLAEKNKPFEGSDILNNITSPDLFADPQFKYKPGKQQIPFDALTGLATGLMGAASADDVYIKYRDEQISEGMLLYAQDIAKIKNMGLSPEIEGGLKMKLQDAYQTGIQNLVHASNGNRNLVLGNQGQLDKARMSGIVEIAALDVERTDKAMAAFGEVQKYISEFESRRDIANNERKYGEDQMKRTAGMELAKQGMSNFIDAIQNAKENGPGSMNDMRRQLFQFNATGILPDAKPGEIGSAEYKEARRVENELATKRKATYADWINTKTMDQQDIINNILKKNPNLDPTKNKQTNFEELKSLYDDVSGTDEYKSEYQKSKGISDLTSNALETKSKKILNETPVDPVLKEKQHIESLDAPIKTMPVTTQKAPVSSTIVTKDKLPDSTLADQLALSANGKESGVNTLNPTIIENQRRMDNAMKSIDEINKNAQVRDSNFEKSQAQSEQKLNSVMYQ